MALVLILLILPGSQLLIYPVLWILMPNEAPAALSGARTRPWRLISGFRPQPRTD
jgi:hypothetical protein